MIDTLPNSEKVHYIWFEPEFSAICFIGKRPFWGTILIEYKPKELLLEFMSVEMWVESLAEQELTIEEVARLTFDELKRALGDIWALRVSVSASTTVHAPAGAMIEEGEW